ncbi:unnamed protein product, partial [Mesorhabditis spiculigera]
MPRGAPVCGPSPLPNGSAPTGDKFFQEYLDDAINCINQTGGFYDRCGKTCISDKYALRLHHHIDLEEVIYGKIFPVLIFLVVIANLTVAVVLSKKHMLSPTNVVLKYMAIADLLVGLVPLPWTLFYFTMGNYRQTEHMEIWWCYMAKFSMDAIPPIFHNIAMWLTVLLATQRYVSISYPFYSRHLCSVKNVRLATMIIMVVSLVCGFPKSIDLNYMLYEGWIFEGDGWSYTRNCLVGHTYVLKLVGMNTYYNLYFWTRAILFIIIPSILLIILNALLIKGIRKAEKRKNRLLRERRPREAAKQTDSNSTSVMLVIIVTIFLVVNLPQAFFMGILCVCETFKIRLHILDGLFPVVFLLVNNMLVMATYPINFWIYCVMSSSFRQTFKALFCKFRVVGTSIGNNTAIELSVAGSGRLSHQEMIESVTQFLAVPLLQMKRRLIGSTLITRTEVSQAYPPGTSTERTRRSDATSFMLLGENGENGSGPNTSRGETIYL